MSKWVVIADSPFLPARGGGECARLGLVQAALAADRLALLVVPTSARMPGPPRRPSRVNTQARREPVGGPARVSTTTGVQGLGMTDGDHLRLREDPQPFGEALAVLLADREQAEIAGAQAGLSRRRAQTAACLPAT